MRLSQLGIGTTFVMAALLVSSSGCGAFRTGLARFPEFTPTQLEGPVTARFLGTSSILFRDSETAILSDGFVSRPRLDEIIFTRINLGITGLALKSKEFVDRYWKEVVLDTGARRVILVHWDDFFPRPR